MLQDNISDAVVDEALACVGAPYWNPGVGDMGIPARSRGEVFSQGISCSMLWNRSRVVAGLSPIGGTPAYAEALGWDASVWEYVNSLKRYPPFTVFVNDDVDWTGDRSHMAVMLQNQRLIESDSWGGVHTQHDLPACDYYNNFYYAGLLGDMPVFAGFPGYSASPRSLAAWIAEVCATVNSWWDVDIPGVLPVMASIPELTSIWVEDRGVDDIRDLRGYSYAVDYDSFGPWQQRLMFFPFPWDFAAALWTFIMRALDEYPGDGTRDPDALAEWCANIQKPAEQYRGRYRYLDDGTDVYAWASDLTSGGATPSNGDSDGSGGNVDPLKADWKARGWWNLGGLFVPEDSGIEVGEVWGITTESGGKKWIEIREGP